MQKISLKLKGLNDIKQDDILENIKDCRISRNPIRNKLTGRFR